MYTLYIEDQGTTRLDDQISADLETGAYEISDEEAARAIAAYEAEREGEAFMAGREAWNCYKGNVR